MLSLADFLAAVIFPVGTVTFLLTAILLPLTFPDRQRWRYLLVYACLSLGVYSFLLAATTAPYAVIEFEPSRVYIRLAYGAAMVFLVPFMVVYFHRALRLQGKLWFATLRAWYGRQVQKHTRRGLSGNGAR